MTLSQNPLIPAKAGTQVSSAASARERRARGGSAELTGAALRVLRAFSVDSALNLPASPKKAWVPAFAGMSGERGLAP